MTPSERYLRELRAQLPPLPRHRRRITAEIRDHLQTGIATGMSGGLTRDGAERRTITLLGPPAVLAAEFRRDLSAKTAITGGRVLALVLVWGFAQMLITWITIPAAVPRLSGVGSAMLGLIGLIVVGLVLVGRRRIRTVAGVAVVLPAVFYALQVNELWLIDRHLGEIEAVIGIAGALLLFFVPPRLHKTTDTRTIELLLWAVAGCLTVETTTRFLHGNIWLTWWLMPTLVAILVVPTLAVALAAGRILAATQSGARGAS